ncbi:hypothetical protein EWH08_02165 [Sphingobium indicum]|uniref:Uncharacterized protein n=2 Tax=Sphingomonadaceae TaxID=41297 RepID=A0A4Q4JAF7_9SPHN|nr:hypothetical protein [Sphingobium indicum]EPR08397.1 hypothetical protein M527_09920 [Sphingobium indicum IP26]EQA98148.1 hypothetical protein L286_21505 [Sphingobium sp. HDIP04]EPR08417.1 hypothetical protein M527_09715 [Sphingobium indicum IP26]EPR17602.1 hypothetical protein M527_16220 [Sphingobium indicum IP26]EPR18324.1 hypothetical protein M527_13050 [Sphingobium indicum IP26]
MEDAMESSLWLMVVVGGPILLAVVLIFVTLSNRRHRNPDDLRHTEEATRDLYRRLDKEDEGRDFAQPGGGAKGP